jgi:hypothetical protein
MPSLSNMTGKSSTTLALTSALRLPRLSFLDTLRVRSRRHSSLDVTVVSSKRCSFACANSNSRWTISVPSQSRTSAWGGILLKMSTPVTRSSSSYGTFGYCKRSLNWPPIRYSRPHLAVFFRHPGVTPIINPDKGRRSRKKLPMLSEVDALTSIRPRGCSDQTLASRRAFHMNFLPNRASTECVPCIGFA